MSSVPTRLSDIPLPLRLRLRLPVSTVARLRVGSVLPLDGAVLVSGTGAGHALAGVALEAQSDGRLVARVTDPTVTTLEALLSNAAAPAMSASSRPGTVVSRTNYAVFRPAPAADTEGRHTQARARLDALVAGLARAIARTPEAFEDAEIRAAGEVAHLGAWVDALHTIAKGEVARVGKGRPMRTFDGWLDGFTEVWVNGALAVAGLLLQRMREGRGTQRDGEAAMNLVALLADTLPHVFSDEKVELVVCRPLDTPFDALTMQVVGHQPASGFDGRVVGQSRVGILRAGKVVKPADVVVA